MSGFWETQRQLPRLPLPCIENSLRQFLEIIPAVVGPDEVREARDLAAGFAAEAAPLQKELERRKISTDNSAVDSSDYPDTHWLERFWENGAYLAGRDPIAVNLNVMINALDDSSNTQHRLERASWYLSGILQFKDHIESGRLSGEQAFKKPLCNAQYRKMFSTTRTPGLLSQGGDKLLVTPESKHIVVESKGHWYKVQMSPPPSPKEIQQVLQEIEKDSEQQREPAGGIGAFASLTATNRDQWALVRNRLVADPVNKSVINTIETAMFAITLSPHEPKTRSECWQAASHSHSNGIWFDKSFTVLIHKNGAIGNNVEHSPVDAVVYVRMFTFAGEFLNRNAPSHCRFKRMFAVPQEKGIVDVVPKEGGGCSWSRLQPRVDGFLLASQRQGLSSIRTLSYNTNLVVDIFSTFGTTQIKKVKTGPDGFIQMGLQLAYYRDQGYIPSTYETAATRLFLHGRTETLRVTSVDSAKFVKLFDDPSVSVSDKCKLFRSATKTHKDRMINCMNGLSFDRHLMALKMVASEQDRPCPKLLQSSAYKFLSNITLSTSQLSGNGAASCGFSSPTPDSYGVCYCLFPQALQFNVASHRDCSQKDSVRFIKAVTTAMTDLMSCLVADQNENAKL
eukprot:TRINITY_DN3677_c1_g1_i1.p1 TRINITY_DN3677_c1_g1~~TRINITY_DN3677_c1_g1_i1.p1  ORF type:complete len:622 (+),score=118.19 TRINITY_DN3677_c1_g1_i1:58-1923(+)